MSLTLIGNLVKVAASKYVEERGIEGILEDANKIVSFAKTTFSGIGQTFSAENHHDMEIDSTNIFSNSASENKFDLDEIESWISSYIPEMEACLIEAQSQYVLSSEFNENIRYILNTGYDIIDQLTDLDEELDDLGDYADHVDSICDDALDLIFNKCNASIESNVTPSNIDKPFSMEIKGIFPVNFNHDMTVITGTIMSGKISNDDIITLPTGKNAIVRFIKMFGKTLDEAECGDICAVILDGNIYDDLETETPFIVGKIPTINESKIESNSVSPEEQDYLTELKACLGNDDIISDRERRLLNKLRQSLGISEERAKELESCIYSIVQLTSEEQEYADEVKACLEDDGEISPKERRLLDKLRDSLGIQPSRAQEIENSII